LIGCNIIISNRINGVTHQIILNESMPNVHPQNNAVIIPQKKLKIEYDIFLPHVKHFEEIFHMLFNFNFR
jgi:hypothetical protein